jgi:hypothetical protein
MKMKFDLKGALIFGLLGWVLGVLLGAINLFPAMIDGVINYIGLFLGFLFGGFDF